MTTAYTLGHSNRSVDELVAVLTSAGINVVCDVRSHPFSRMAPQFNKDALKKSLNGARIRYLFLGKELGGRPTDPALYDKDGRASYSCMALNPMFGEGVERVLSGLAKGYVPALLCSEKDPMQCHRALLIGRELERRGVRVVHLHDSARTETQQILENRLIKHLHLHPDLLHGETPASLVERAYEVQAGRVAYLEKREEHNAEDLHDRVYAD